MSNIAVVKCIPEKNLECSKEILKNFEKHNWVYLAPPKDQTKFSTSLSLPEGEGIIIASGGSIGGPNLCLQSIKNLTKSALATGKWLKNHGLTPNECIILNSLPLHHISGFMPWWRHRTWRSEYHWISPSFMHEPLQLRQFSEALANKYRRPLITSLVPTQLLSLIDNPDGLKWLQSLALIWLGGALIPIDLADKARRKSINLAPCYGATETGAMVTCLSPKDFIKGSNSVGFPLEDVEIEINKRHSLKIKTSRIATSKWNNGKFVEITDTNGWWEAGDLAQYISLDNRKAIQILGRRDSAINSGGETIFPEDIEIELMKIVSKHQIPIKDIFVLGVSDKKWGQRLVALTKFKEKEINRYPIISLLTDLIEDWQPSKKPLKWYDCPKLSRNINKKWEIKKWQDWIVLNRPIN
ncbi:AMP-binding protein [Prochlorococcus marinus]|uniref:AMP-binding protein n=1 Tax=Prochlorococcus marinus TaxID=1219 RepID=UPI0022B3194E|nr:AMP-binding protein [Prochlorococcus marinus]